MKKIKLLNILLLGYLVFPMFVQAQNIKITQIDSGSLLAFSQIDCYLNISNNNGEIIENADLSLISIEHDTSQGMKPAEILNIQRNNSANEQITFLLLMDNSGSMYEPVGKGIVGTRMDHAVRAAKEFLNSIDNPNLRVGLAVFNTNFNLLSKPVHNTQIIENALDSIAKPDSKDAYTELFYSIEKASVDMSAYKGRKAIVLLSDGENYPLFKNSGKDHPEFGKRLYKPADATYQLKNTNITLYGINFSSNKDPFLSSISIASGGEIYNAFDDKELVGVYNKIKNRIELEYKVTIKAPINFLDMSVVKAEYVAKTDTMEYKSSSLLGGKSNSNLLLVFIILLFSIGFWFILLKFRFEKSAKGAELSMLPYGNGKALKQTIALTSMKTVIGGSLQADFTVTGIPDLKESHAEIVKDEKTGSYTVISDEEILVNNNITRKRKLKPGDVINIEGATIVFDAVR